MAKKFTTKDVGSYLPGSVSADLWLEEGYIDTLIYVLLDKGYISNNKAQDLLKETMVLDDNVLDTVADILDELEGILMDYVDNPLLYWGYNDNGEGWGLWEVPISEVKVHPDRTLEITTENGDYFVYDVKNHKYAGTANNQNYIWERDKDEDFLQVLKDQGYTKEIEKALNAETSRLRQYIRNVYIKTIK